MYTEEEVTRSGTTEATLYLGVTGHIWDTEPAGVRRRAREVIRRLGSDRRLVVVSPLAAGADRLVAEEGLEAGARLEAVLPFAAAEYEQDAPGSVAAFRSLLARCSAVEVLPGDPTPGADRDAAYAAAGRAVVARSDLVVAIWDGAPARGHGGTGEVVAHAVAEEVPVAWIGMDGGLRLLAPEARRRELSAVLGLSGAD